MNEAPFNPDDIDFLASRDLDGDLTAEERRRLGDALDASESLRAKADAMRRVSDLVRRWAAAPVEIDWDAHTELIDGRCQADDDAQDRPEVDGILKRWARDVVAHDDEQFTADVMRRIGQTASTARTRSGRPWMIRIAVPLAAAAVLAMALIGGSWINRDAGSRDVGRVVLTESPLGATKVPTCIVRFAREPLDVAPDVRQSRGISFTAFGVATVGVGAAPAVP